MHLCFAMLDRSVIAGLLCEKQKMRTAFARARADEQVLPKGEVSYGYEQTHMKHVALGGALSSLLLLACQSDELSPPGSSPTPLNLSSPQVGQSTAYIRISLLPGDTLASEFADTLLLTVTELNSGSFTVEEELSEHSTSRSGRPAVALPSTVFRYRLSPKPEGLSVLPLEGDVLESRLFPSLNEQEQQLDYGMMASASARLAGLRPQVPYLPRDRSFRLGNSAESAAVAVLAHSGRDEGLPGFTFVHRVGVGLDFMLVEHDLAGHASGWRRLGSDR